jgi:hypothetical protein
MAFRKRFSVVFRWIYSYVFVRRGSRRITRYAPGSDTARGTGKSAPTQSFIRNDANNYFCVSGRLKAIT